LLYFEKILNVMAKTNLVVESQYIRIILSPNSVAINCILILYGLWRPKCLIYKYCNSGNDVAIFRVEDVQEHDISTQDFKYQVS